MIDMCRSSIKSAFQGAFEHPGLLFSRGLPHWNEDPTRRGAEFAEFIQRVAAQPAPAIYCRAYERWRNLIVDASRFACWCGRVDGRLFLGLGGAHVLETNLTLSQQFPLSRNFSIISVLYMRSR